jgi:NADH-quinone oxidoreductase subunit J
MLPIAIGCLVAVSSALWVVLARRPVHGAVGLLGHSLALAGLYLLLGADLVAMGQVLIYSGAIVVLFLFVVALMPAGGAEGAPSFGRLAAAAIGCGAILLALAFVVGTISPGASDSQVGGVVEIGRALFAPDRLLLAFELTAPLLLVAIVGAVAIWRRQGAERHL